MKIWRGGRGGVKGRGKLEGRERRNKMKRSIKACLKAQARREKKKKKKRKIYGSHKGKQRVEWFAATAMLARTRRAHFSCVSKSKSEE